ncbi:MAG: L-threonylcarbamoyladenylate synthase [Bacteroidales bacterium]
MKDSEILYQGKVLIYPTDTIWGIGCDARNVDAIKKIKLIKGRDNTKSLILLVKDLMMLKDYVEYIPQVAINMINSTKQPTTIIYSKAKNLPITHLSVNESIGIRIPHNDYLYKLFQEFDYPIVSTSANFSGSPSPLKFTDIDKDFLSKADYVSLYNRDIDNGSNASSIYLIEKDNTLTKIR